MLLSMMWETLIQKCFFFKLKKDQFQDKQWEKYYTVSKHSCIEVLKKMEAPRALDRNCQIKFPWLRECGMVEKDPKKQH